MTASVPDLADVLTARQRIAPYLRPTSLYRYPALDAMTGAQLWVKHENHQPVGAFKVRGGVNLVSQLTADERRRGVITASTGNHGQSVAYAANLFGVRAIICVPEQANPVKVDSMRALGAEIVFFGKDFDDAREYCEKQAVERGYRYIHSACCLTSAAPPDRDCGSCPACRGDVARPPRDDLRVPCRELE